ncbi:PEST proteolytic signal-containing nuclear protein [Sergentomyia squamirostris]
MSGRQSNKYDQGSYASGGNRRSRSRSPVSPEMTHHREYSSDEEEDNKYLKRHRSQLKYVEKHPSREKPHVDEQKKRSPPPPPMITKVSMSFGKPAALPKPGIQMKLNSSGRPEGGKISVASAFNADSDDEVEEMPAECRMRMRNIGRDTPTSSGPNSFGKTKQGFCDAKKILEKNLRDTADE